MGAGDLFSIEGKVAIVTGGSRGIGLMIARGFVEAGAKVYISSRSADVCDAVASELTTAGPGECVSVPTDLSTAPGIERLAGEVSSREGALHILVNNAGRAWGAPLEEHPDSAFDKVYAVNVKAPFHLTVKLLPLLRKAATPDDPARVIMIGSIDGLRVPWFDNFSYSASKGALHMLARHMASRVAKDNITVNVIAPGPFESKMTRFVFENPELREGFRQGVPLSRHGRPDDMAGAAIFLASRAGSYLTGTVIPVDGGLSTVV